LRELCPKGAWLSELLIPIGQRSRQDTTVKLVLCGKAATRCCPMSWQPPESRRALVSARFLVYLRLACIRPDTQTTDSDSRGLVLQHDTPVRVPQLTNN